LWVFWQNQYMWFKNLCLLRVNEPFTISEEQLQLALEKRSFRHCTSLEPASAGWFSPIGKDGFPLVHGSGGYLMLCLQKEEKVIPAGAINDLVQEKVLHIQFTQNRPVRRKERETIREEVLQDMLPRAFTQRRRTYAYIDVKDGWLVVDSSSPRKTEDFVSVLRQTLGNLSVSPLSTKERPSLVMTTWLLPGADLPSGITLESECELRSPGEDGSIIRCRRHDLDVPEIQNHVSAGKEAIKLALTWDDRLSLVIDDALNLRRIKFLDLIQEAAAEIETDDDAQRFDTDFAIMTLELSRFFSSLIPMFGGENSDRT